MTEAENRVKKVWLEGLQEEAVRLATSCKELAKHIYGESIDAAHYFEKAASWLDEAELEMQNKVLDYTEETNGM